MTIICQSSRPEDPSCMRINIINLISTILHATQDARAWFSWKPAQHSRMRRLPRPCLHSYRSRRMSLEILPSPCTISPSDLSGRSLLNNFVTSMHIKYFKHKIIYCFKGYLLMMSLTMKQLQMLKMFAKHWRGWWMYPRPILSMTSANPM